MKEKNSYNFLVGLILGTMACLIIWYWQKSTRAEDGALDLLDRLKAAESKIREIRTSRIDTAVMSPAHHAEVVADDLTKVKGIGPVFADRLMAAGVQSFRQLAALSTTRLAEILAIQPGRAERILAEAAVVLD